MKKFNDYLIEANNYKLKKKRPLKDIKFKKTPSGEIDMLSPEEI